jgi:hypothetical protein
VRFAVIALSLALAYRFASHAPLRRYFAANLGCSVVWEALLLRWSYNSTIYAVAWCLGIACIYIFELELMWASICFVPVRYRLILPAFALSLLLVWNSHPRGLFEWIQYVSGGMDLFAAIPCGLGAAYLSGTPRKIAVSLAFLWLVQSLYEFGFGLHLSNPAWITLNSWAPTFILAAGSLWLCFCAREQAAYNV